MSPTGHEVDGDREVVTRLAGHECPGRSTGRLAWPMDSRFPPRLAIGWLEIVINLSRRAGWGQAAGRRVESEIARISSLPPAAQNWMHVWGQFVDDAFSRIFTTRDKLTPATPPRVKDRHDIAVQPTAKPDVAITSSIPKWRFPNLASLFVIFGLLVGGGCLLPGLFTVDDKPKVPPEFVTKNIEDIEVGDFVLARDEFGNEIGLRRVVEVYRRTSDHLRILRFEANDGSQQTLETTDEHPFWIVGDETFTEAKDLKVGDQVTSPHGELQTLIDTYDEPKPEGVPVFNFQVEGYHTYYVREHGTRGPPVLMHNADYDPKDKPKHAPTPKKWEKKGGKIDVDEDGNWTYTDRDGNSVTYRNGYPDFEETGLVNKSVDIDEMQGDHYHDYKAANKEAGYGEGAFDHPDETTWHHHENLSTMQNMDSDIHNRFSHQGGVSKKKGSN